MNRRLKILFSTGGQKNVGYGNFNYNLSPIPRKKRRNCMLFTAKENVIIIEWPACVPTAHVAVRSC
jgi:hypothetical protein